MLLAILIKLFLSKKIGGPSKSDGNAVVHTIRAFFNGDNFDGGGTIKADGEDTKPALGSARVGITSIPSEGQSADSRRLAMHGAFERFRSGCSCGRVRMILQPCILHP